MIGDDTEENEPTIRSKEQSDYEKGVTKMYGFRKYSRAWLSVLIIILAGYAGMSFGYTLNTTAGQCSSIKNNVVKCSKPHGCCLADPELEQWECISCLSSQHGCEGGTVYNFKRIFWCTTDAP